LVFFSPPKKKLSQTYTEAAQMLRDESALLKQVEDKANDMGWDIAQAKARVDYERLERERKAKGGTRSQRPCRSFSRPIRSFGRPKPANRSVMGGDPEQELEEYFAQNPKG